jgi:hypothetical protein
VQLLAGHAYAATAVGTGGRGTAMNPPTGIAAPNSPVLVVYRSFFALGGGGGGFATPGTVATMNPFTGISTTLGNRGPGGAAGAAFSLFPYPVLNPPPGYSSLQHFLVGGSGGGGGGTHAFGTITIPATADVYVAGAGGSGGGGALALRAGNDVTIGATASLQSKGGAGVQITGRDPNVASGNASWGVACAGGGGSGGSCLLQSGSSLTVNGTVDVRGGAGSSTGNIFVPQFAVTSQAGAGAAGNFRFEAPGAINFGGTCFPAYTPAVHAGTLTDRDARTGCASLWRATNWLTVPHWHHYELDVDSDGNGTVDVTYTDTGAAGTQLANDPNGPVVVHFQGARLSPGSSTPVPGTIGPWREAVGTAVVPGIELDGADGCRFELVFNFAVFPNCVVRGLRIHFG